MMKEYPEPRQGNIYWYEDRLYILYTDKTNILYASYFSEKGTLNRTNKDGPTSGDVVIKGTYVGTVSELSEIIKEVVCNGA